MTERAALIDFIHQWGLVADAVFWSVVAMGGVAVVAWAWGRVRDD